MRYSAMTLSTTMLHLLKSTEELHADIKFSDALGKVIYASSLNLKSVYTTLEVPLEISSGVYLVSLSTSKEIWTRKIFVE